MDDPGVDALVVEVGLDSHDNAKGDAEFVILGDAKELARQRSRAADAPALRRLLAEARVARQNLDRSE